MKALFAMLLVCAALFTLGDSRVSGQQAELIVPKMEEPWYLPKDVEVDVRLGQKPITPSIPKSWRFVGVASSATTGTDLWFELPDGTLALVHGFRAARFMIDREIQFIARK